MKEEEDNRHIRNAHAKQTIPPYVKALSGSIGGIVEACCLQPIDVIKTRLQLDRSGIYKGIIHCGATIYRTEGVRALWKGLTPFATHLTLKYALRMGSNAVLQSAFKDSETGKLSHHGRLLSGFGAGVLEALVIVTPFEEQSDETENEIRQMGPVRNSELEAWVGNNETTLCFLVLDSLPEMTWFPNEPAVICAHLLRHLLHGHIK